jgi:hypothetical protein
VSVELRPKKNVGDSGDIPTPNVESIGDIAISNIDKGDAGMSGEAVRKSGCCRGGTRNGFIGDIGILGERGEGVSGSQYDIAGTGGVRDVVGMGAVEVVQSRGKVARRGVGGRGAHHEGVEIVRDTEAQRVRILNKPTESTGRYQRRLVSVLARLRDAEFSQK